MKSTSRLSMAYSASRSAAVVRCGFASVSKVHHSSRSRSAIIFASRVLRGGVRFLTERHEDQVDVAVTRQLIESLQ